MGRSIYDIKRLKLGWFNAWVGFIWILLFIHSFKFFFSYESFLKRSFKPIKVTFTKIDIEKDSSKMKIITEKGTFYHYNKDNFKIIDNISKNNKYVEIWFDKEDSSAVDFKVNDRFLIKKTNSEIIVWLIALIISGSMVILSTILVIQTKGWGAYDLMKKHNKSMLKYIIDTIEPWSDTYKTK